MHNHTLLVMDLELSFKSEAEPERIKRACTVIEERYARLLRNGGMVSKEKLLAFLALSLADDVVQLLEEQSRTNKRLQEFLGNIEKVAG